MIASLTGQHAPLSNFWLARIEFEGATYPSVENAYQAAKVPSDMRDPFRACTPADAKRLGRTVALPGDWEERKVALMEALLRRKFDPATHPRLVRCLVETLTENLVEGNTWGDTFWGQVQRRGGWVGHNMLGVLLMKLRAELTPEGKGP